MTRSSSDVAPPEGADLDAFLDEARVKIDPLLTSSSRQPKRLRKLAVGAIAGAIIAGSGAAVANVGPFAKSETEIARSQERLDEVAAPIPEYTHRAGDRGIALDIENDTLTLWWKGPVDPAVQRVIQDVGKVRVRVVPAKYTRAELASASNRILRYKAADGSFEVRWVTLESKGRPTFEHGLIAGVRIKGGQTEQAVEAELSRIAGLPVTLSHEEEMHRL